MREKIGVGITTYNHEDYFEPLYESIDSSFIDEFVVVNGGDEYDKKYDCHWIQHHKNSFPSVCRNDCASFLINRGCDHIFLIEDDMVIKDPDIFNRYIEASKQSGLKYFNFVSTSAGAGEPYKRNPRIKVEYKNNVSLSFYNNMCNEFTYHHKSCFEKAGLYDGNMREAFDVELAYRESLIGDWASPFWWFADISDSDDYIENNPETISRLQSERPDGSRAEIIDKIWEYFYNKHGLHVPQIPNVTKDEFLKRIKTIRESSRI
jgi:glycosyltransferase involved in cell wall biosynthesis